MMHLLAVFFLAHWFQFFFVGNPWYVAAIWGNVFCIVVVAPLGWLWSKTKFWPLNYLEASTRHLHEKVDHLHRRHDEHAKALSQLAQRVEDLHKKVGPDEDYPHN